MLLGCKLAIRAGELVLGKRGWRQVSAGGKKVSVEGWLKVEARTSWVWGKGTAQH